MDCKINITNPLCFYSIDGRIDLDITNNIGRIFVDWQNLPKEAVLANEGKIVYNLSRGEYNFIIFDDISQQSFKVSVESPPEFIIDFIRVDEPKCIEDIKNIEIAWSGGKPPYRLSIGENYTGLLYDTYYKTKIKPNIEYSIFIIDSNGCKIVADRIYYPIKELHLDLDITHPKCSGCTAPKIKLDVTGGRPPYKIGWFHKNNPNTPIITNKFDMNHKLLGGHYTVSVIDANNCYQNLPFVIDSPSPIKVNTKIKADYSHNQFYEPVKITKIYNLLLLDESIDDIDLGEKIEIACSNGIKMSVALVFDTGKITVGQKIYKYYYISPGIYNIDDNLKYSIFIKNKEYLVSNNLDNDDNKILVGSFILDNNYSFAFNENDTIELLYDKYKITSQIKYRYIVKGYYINDNIVTILTFLNQKNMEKILKILNTYGADNFYVRSKTTKKNNNLGNINIIVSGGSGKNYTIHCIGKNYDKTFINKGYLIIDSLHAGEYKLSIRDDINIAEYHNNLPIDNSNDGIVINIPGSAEEETTILTKEIINKYKIDPALLNNYNNRPERLPIFGNNKNQSSLIVNIAPTDAEFTIFGDNYEYKSVGYQTVNEIKPGVYSIKVYKKGYKEQSQDFSVSKNNLNIVTIILEKG